MFSHSLWEFLLFLETLRLSSEHPSVHSQPHGLFGSNLKNGIQIDFNYTQITLADRPSNNNGRSTWLKNKRQNAIHVVDTREMWWHMHEFRCMVDSNSGNPYASLFSEFQNVKNIALLQIWRSLINSIFHILKRGGNHQWQTETLSSSIYLGLSWRKSSCLPVLTSEEIWRTK